jgi:hypothetical protein
MTKNQKREYDKKYKVPANTTEIIVKENILCVIIKSLIKVNDDWRIEHKITPLEEIKDA